MFIGAVIRLLNFVADASNTDVSVTIPKGRNPDLVIEDEKFKAAKKELKRAISLSKRAK